MSPLASDSIGLFPDCACAGCLHFDSNYQACPAFPNGIPTAILEGENNHSEPFPGDNGIRFERRAVK